MPAKLGYGANKAILQLVSYANLDILALKNTCKYIFFHKNNNEIAGYCKVEDKSKTMEIGPELLDRTATKKTSPSRFEGACLEKNDQINLYPVKWIRVL